MVSLGLADMGNLSFIPCKAILPFYYPPNYEENKYEVIEHFDFFDKAWLTCVTMIPEFREHYITFSQTIDRGKECDLQLERRLLVLREACKNIDTNLTIVAHNSDSEVGFEVNTHHISGPPLPPHPNPRTDIQLFNRLDSLTESYMGIGQNKLKNGVLIEAALDGGSSEDRVIDILISTPNAQVLLKNLKKLNLRCTRISPKKVEDLQKFLPWVYVNYLKTFNDD